MMMHPYALMKASPSSGRIADPSPADGGLWKNITQFLREGAFQP